MRSPGVGKARPECFRTPFLLGWSTPAPRLRRSPRLAPATKGAVLHVSAPLRSSTELFANGWEPGRQMPMRGNLMPDWHIVIPARVF